MSPDFVYPRDQSDEERVKKMREKIEKSGQELKDNPLLFLQDMR